jgi:hypothetical protein
VSGNTSSSSSADALTAATLFHAGPGMFGVAAAIAGHETSTTTPTELDQKAMALYLTYGMDASDNVSWGVALDWATEDSDQVFVGPVSTTDEADSIQVKGGVKFQSNEDFWWSVRGVIGAPDEEDTSTVGPSSTEFDGQTIGAGADLNWAKKNYDLEVSADFWTNDWDADATSGGSAIFSGDVTEDILRLQGRAYHKIGRADVWKSLGILQIERDADLLTGTTPDSATEDEFVIAPTAAVRFPFGCRECDVTVAGIVGAGYTIIKTENDSRFGTSTFGTESTDYDANMRLGLEVKGERFAFDVMWDSDSSDPSLVVPPGGISTQEGSREHVSNDRLIFGATLQM